MLSGWTPGTPTAPFYELAARYSLPEGPIAPSVFSKCNCRCNCCNCGCNCNYWYLQLPLLRIATATARTVAASATTASAPAIIAIGDIDRICGILNTKYLFLSCGSSARSPNRTLGRDFVRVGHHAMGAVQLTLFARREIVDRVKVTVLSGCCLSIWGLCLSIVIHPSTSPFAPLVLVSFFSLALATAVMHFDVCYAPVCMYTSPALIGKRKKSKPTQNNLVPFFGGFDPSDVAGSAVTTTLSAPRLARCRTPPARRKPPPTRCKTPPTRCRMP